MIINRKKIAVLALLLLIGSFPAAGTGSVSIIVSGESHGMIEGCECVRDPGGGLARRASALKQIRDQGPVLLLDAGGFSAGDLYDSYTEGRSSDSVRTSVMIKGMGFLQYDVIALGDDDLQYDVLWLKRQIVNASLPVISANCFISGNQRLVKPYLIVKKGSVSFGITALTSDERLLETDRRVTVKDPLAALKAVLPELREKSDIQIVISHCGNEMADSIAAEFPDIDLVVNGHRKMSNEPLYMTGKIPVMQFGFQGKSLSIARIGVEKNVLNVFNSAWIHLDPSVHEDTGFVNTLKYVLPSRNDVYDLYIMSQCPYGLEALRSFMEFQRSFPAIQFNIRFIGSVENNGALKSLHGESEIKEEMVWLGVKRIYPEKWNDFLTARSQSSSLTSSIFNDLGMDFKAIEEWVHKDGSKELTGHYQRSIRLNINASPTLHINNVPYEETISVARLGRMECRKNVKVSAFCDSLPACIEDRDCKMEKKLGKCVSDTCLFIDAVRFPFTALVNDSLEEQVHLSVIKTTEDLFPGTEIFVESVHSNKGMELLKKWNYPPIPFYKFGKDVQHAHNFSAIENGIVPFEDGFTFKRGLMKYNYFPGRKLTNGEIVILADPFFQEIQTIIEMINSLESKKTLSIKPIIFTDPSMVLPGTIERFRQDEAFRWLSIAALNRDSFNAYMLHYSKNPGNSMWPNNVKSAGINPDTISNLLQRDRADVLQNYYSFLSELGLENPFYILRNNRELIPVKSKEELLKIIEER
jgi:hypothetical protein